MPKIIIVIFSLIIFNPLIAQEALPFELEADKIKVENKTDELFASGNVIIKYKTYSIQSEEAIFKRSKNTLFFKKNISIIDTKNNSLTADEVNIDLNTDRGIAKNGTIRTFNNYLISAKSIELNENEFLLKECNLTTCTSKTPEWYVNAKEISILKKTNVVNSKGNTLYFYQIPVFIIPSYSQSISDETISNKPTPEFGYNQIDGTYINGYVGYLISESLSGKAGIGTSENRGFRYGATHTYKPTKNQGLIVKTYDVEKTNFEGGISYRWKETNETLELQPLVNSLYIPTENQTLETYFEADYLYDNINYNELYHAIPNLSFGINNINFYFSTKLSGKLGLGYFKDRLDEANRSQIEVNVDRTIIEFNEKSKIRQKITLKNNYYKDNTTHWQRIYNTTSLQIPILKSNHVLSYTKLFYNSGASPFVFDTINEITDDEVSLESEIILLPIVLKLESNYQINQQSYRNFRYTASYVFQCWQFDISIDTIWEEVSYGISIPDISKLF